MANEKEPRGSSRWTRLRRILMSRFQAADREDAKPRARQRWIGAAVLIALFVTSYTYFSRPPVEAPGGGSEPGQEAQEPIVIPEVVEELPVGDIPPDENGTAAPGTPSPETAVSEESAGNEATGETGNVEETQPVTATAAGASLPALHWPLRGMISRTFGWAYSDTYQDWRLHEGLDIVAPQGSMVVAAATGRVSSIREEPLWGRVVVIDHGQGVEIRYAGLGVLQVREGQQVVKGQPLGRLGEPSADEAAQGSHLHLVTRVNGQAVDPLPAFGELARDS